MASTQKPAIPARSPYSTGNASHDAQRRVNKRVIEIMARRAAAERRASSADLAAAMRQQPDALEAFQDMIGDSLRGRGSPRGA